MYDGFFAEFGLPRQLHSDLGRNFEGKLFHELCQLTGISKVIQRHFILSLTAKLKE